MTIVYDMILRSWLKSFSASVFQMFISIYDYYIGSS